LSSTSICNRQLFTTSAPSRVIRRLVAVGNLGEASRGRGTTFRARYNSRTQGVRSRTRSEIGTDGTGTVCGFLAAPLPEQSSIPAPAVPDRFPRPPENADAGRDTGEGHCALSESISTLFVYERRIGRGGGGGWSYTAQRHELKPRCGWICLKVLSGRYAAAGAAAPVFLRRRLHSQGNSAKAFPRARLGTLPDGRPFLAMK